MPLIRDPDRRGISEAIYLRKRNEKCVIEKGLNQAQLLNK